MDNPAKYKYSSTEENVTALQFVTKMVIGRQLSVAESPG